jgi:hypothetical protein
MDLHPQRTAVGQLASQSPCLDRAPQIALLTQINLFFFGQHGRELKLTKELLFSLRKKKPAIHQLFERTAKSLLFAARWLNPLGNYSRCRKTNWKCLAIKQYAMEISSMDCLRLWQNIFLNRSGWAPKYRMYAQGFTRYMVRCFNRFLISTGTLKDDWRGPSARIWKWFENYF